MILLIDNYDSFAHNLARYVRLLGEEVVVVRNDKVDANQVRSLAPEAIVLSPGPCTPAEAGCSIEVVRQLHESIPMLGVCLGHQAIGAALGAEVVRAPRPVHGQASSIRHDGAGLFASMPKELTVGRYHSLVLDPPSLPACLRPTAWTECGLIMAVRHAWLPVVGVQFHPESVLTHHGTTIVENFLRLARRGPVLTPFAMPTPYVGPLERSTDA